MNPFTSGSFGKGTPDPGRDRGAVFRVTTAGSYVIEARAYEAGSGSVGSRFCDYWISFKGVPVDAAVQSLLGFDVNHYNNCGALLRLRSTEYAFVLGAYVGSGGGYVPIFFGEQDGQLMLHQRPACILNSHKEGSEQAVDGWTVTDGQVEICGTRWEVVPESLAGS